MKYSIIDKEMDSRIKLTAFFIKAVRNMREYGLSYTVIADLFEVDRTTVYKACNFDFWEELNKTHRKNQKLWSNRNPNYKKIQSKQRTIRNKIKRKTSIKTRVYDRQRHKK